MKLEGKRFVVTGSATGMGAATVAAFVREGAEVVGFYRSRGYEALAERLAGEPGSAHFVKVDVSEKEEVFPAMAAAAERLGGSEWFALSEALGTHIDSLSAGVDDPWNLFARWTSEAFARRG